MLQSGRAPTSATEEEIIAILDGQVRTQVKAALAGMPHAVKMLMFTQREGTAPRHLVSADMVEVTGFPHLARRYQVPGGPLTVVNETIRIEGAVPEPALISRMAPLGGK